MFQSYNPYVLVFESASTHLKENNSESMSIQIITDERMDQRRYNKSSSSEVAALIPGLDGEMDKLEDRRVITFEKTGKVKITMIR